MVRSRTRQYDSSAFFIHMKKASEWDAILLSIIFLDQLL